MFIAISPGQKKPIEKPKNLSKNESEEPICVSLAPFTGNGKLFFDNIPVDTAAERRIIIKNPLHQNVELSIRKTWPDDIKLNLSWYQNTIPKNGELSLDLEWTPDKVGAWRFILIIEDAKKIRKDIPVALKSYGQKKTKTKKQDIPKYVVKRASPVKPIKKSPKNQSIIASSSIQNKENLKPIIPTEIRRETYTLFKSNLSVRLNKSSSPRLKEININVDETFEDSLEIKATNANTFTITPIRNNSHRKSLSFTSTPTSFLLNEHKSIQDDIKQHLSPDLLNVSRQTYTKHNTSTKTYVINGNISAETIKNSSIGNLNLLSSSDFTMTRSQSRDAVHFANLSGSGAKGIIQANLWCDDTDKVKSSTCFTSKSLFNSSLNQSLKRKSNSVYDITPPKRAYLDNRNCKSISKGIKTWSKSTSMAFRINKVSSGLNIKHNQDAVSVGETITREVFMKNPFLTAATCNFDPFLNPYFEPDDEWFDQQVKSFTNWLNALLTPPSELNSTKDSPVDIGQLWIKCKKGEVALAPTKEAISYQYHTSSRLEALRRNALKLLKSPEIRGVLNKVNTAIDNKKLLIRKDRDVHLDLGLQSEIMKVLLSYNPLWLRIGLETTYNTIIPLNSNSDIVHLITFIMQRFFKNPILLKKYKTIHCPKYAEAIKVFILKKFLALIYFLDQAKLRKLINHDPCLFCRNAPIKDSREALFLFARETLSAVGDITKYLKYFGYIVQHKQTYINEFDYAVRNLGVDLRDGVRLTKIMEIILIKDNLIDNLRVPAISRVQKIHNMEIVFNALKNAGYNILSDIDPRDIVDGHKEKTLSFLWQIIYKFEAPLWVKSVTTIQKWWRSPKILEKRQQLRETFLKKDQAARTIQLWYQRKKQAEFFEYIAKNYRLYIEYCRRNRAAIKIQSYIRMRLCRRQYLRIYQIIINIQRLIRRQCLRNIYKRKNNAAIKLQSFFKMLLAKKRFEQLCWAVNTTQKRFRANQICKIQRHRYLTIKTSALIIQQYYRNYKMMQLQRANYLQQQNAAIKIQQWFRNILIMRVAIAEFESIKVSTILIQRRFRANLLAKQQRQQYLKIRNAAVKIQHYYRCYCLMQKQRNDYLKKREASIQIQRWFRMILIRNQAMLEFESIRKATLVIQRRFRANQEMRIQQASYKSLRKAVIIIQNRYRALQSMRQAIENYQKLKSSTIIVQRRFRAVMIGKQQRLEYLKIYESVVKIQRKYRARLQMKKDIEKFQNVKAKIIVLQTWFRATILAKQEHQKYLRLKQSTMTIQQYYRCYRLMKFERNCYQQKKEAAIKIQIWFKSILEMRRLMDEYKNYKKATIVVQRRFRATNAMKIQKQSYLTLKQAVIVIQTRYRAILLMRQQIEEYNKTRSAVIVVQRRFKAKLEGKRRREEFVKLRQAALKIQCYYRGYILMKNQRNYYLENRKKSIKIQRWFRGILARNQAVKEYENIRKATITIQRRFRANQSMKIDRQSYISLKNATIIIQTRYRSLVAMRESFNDYQQLKLSVIVIQRRFRSNCAARIQRQQYLKLQRSVLKIQHYWRAYQLMKFERQNYRNKRDAAIKIQRRFRAVLAKNEAVKQFENIKKAVLTIQRQYRANKLMKLQRNSYLSLKKAVINIQIRYRALNVMRQQFNDYNKLKSSIIVIQRRFRANRDCHLQRQQYLKIQRSVIVIQQYWRACRLMKLQWRDYLRKRDALIKIQNWFKAILARNQAMRQFQTIKRAVLIIQRQYRANQLMKIEQKSYLSLKKAVKMIQTRYRSLVVMRQQFNDYQTLRSSVIVVQRRFRAKRIGEIQRQQFLQIHNSIVTIQRFWRSYQLMKLERQIYVNKQVAVIRIQRWFRAVLLRNQAVIHFESIKRATIVIQTRFKAYRQMKIQRQQYFKIREAVTRIQRYWRGYQLMKIEKRNYLEKREATITIQKWFRTVLLMRRAVEQFKITKEAVYTIQKRYRATKEMQIQRNNYLTLKRAAIVIQIRYRAILMMRQQVDEYRKLRSAAITIQIKFREFLIKKRLKLAMINKKKIDTIVHLQRYIRGYLIRKRYAWELSEEGKQERKLQKLRNEKATKIQAAWRGYKLRKNQKGRIVVIRQKFIEANNRAQPADTLHQRCNQAIICLEDGSASLVQIMRALEDIDFITRRSQNICLKLSPFMAENMYRIIVTSGRSLPEMSISKVAALILTTFFRYPPSRQHAWKPIYLDKLLTIMLHWCDKEASLFPALCTLFWLFLQIEQYKAEILKIPDIHYKLLRINNLLTRKQKMVKKVTAFSGSVFYPSVSHLPNTTPDWGLDFPTKPRTFINSFFAFEAIVSMIGQ